VLNYHPVTLGLVGLQGHGMREARCIWSAVEMFIFLSFVF